MKSYQKPLCYLVTSYGRWGQLSVSCSQELKNEKSIVSPESLSYGRSRSGKCATYFPSLSLSLGRLLLPAMEFWRNQLPVYDADRKITGIMTEKDVRSVPQKGKRKCG
uniref:CBS domain-containing protein n=1 Tax=Quercus lobata TaxID=97700 RepID=A0A7N2M5A1_QUELO